MIAQLLYLQLVRQWPFYGSTYFIACSEIPPKGYFEHRTETLYVAINSDGINVINADKPVRILICSPFQSRLLFCSTIDLGSFAHFLVSYRN